MTANGKVPGLCDGFCEWAVRLVPPSALTVSYRAVRFQRSEDSLGSDAADRRASANDGNRLKLKFAR